MMNTLRFFTPRLLVKDMAPEDCAYAAAEWGHPEYGRYMADPAYRDGGELLGILRETLEAHESWTDDFYFSVFDRDTGGLIGTACAFAEKEPGVWGIGYSISHERWGQGLATELISGLVAFAGERGASVVTAIAAQANTASVKACQKNGFAVASEGSFKKGGTDIVHASYTLTKRVG